MTDTIICTLRRLTTGNEGTFGEFAAPSLDFSARSLELPARQNRPMISRIPSGEYPAFWMWSKRFKRMTYRLDAVPGRTGILIHPANFGGDTSAGYATDLSGCIALGNITGKFPNHLGKLQNAILRSAKCVQRFEQAANRHPLLITIIDEPSPPPPPELCDEP